MPSIAVRVGGAGSAPQVSQIFPRPIAVPLSLDQFVEQLTSNGVLSSDEIEPLRREFKGANTEQFARELVKQKKLTAFQAQQCFSGKGKSLTLGNYVVIDKLGQGGMGMVLKAQHRRMKRLVAVKVLSPSVSKSADLIKRFQREVEAAARLTHPNIVAAYDSDEANGTVFLVMEYVEGKDLSSLVKSKGPLSVDRAVECILQAARGLEYAHKCGIIHRDIKPANLLLSNEGVIKILDMGLARIEGETGSRAELTNTGAVMGTVDYMAPEQALNTKLADARSDIYSLGISLWYLLVGRPAYEADSLMARLLAHREAPIPSLKDARGGVPPGLDNIFQKMIAKNPEERFASMTDVIAALEAGFQSEGATPTLTTGASEASKFNDFLQNLNDVSAGVAVTSSFKTRKIRKGARSDATIQSSDSDIPTDPETLTRLPGRRAGHVSSWKALLAKGTGWRDRKLQGAAGAGLLITLCVLLAILGRDKPDSVPSVADNDEKIEVVSRDAGTLTIAEASSALPTTGLGTSLRGNDGTGPRSALQFDGIDDYVDIADEGWEWDGKELTFEAWIIPPELTLAPDQRRSFILFELDQGSKASRKGGRWKDVYHIRSDSGKIHHDFHTTTFHRDDVQAVGVSMSPGRLTHVAGVWRGDQVMTFVDGRLRSGSNFEYKFPERSAPPYLRLGGGMSRSPGGGLHEPWQGQLVQARISSRALYSEAFQPEADLEAKAETVALYKANEIDGTTLKDLSGNQRHGRIVGASRVPIDGGNNATRLSVATEITARVPALEFDGIDDYISLPPDWRWDGKELTFEAWIVPADLQPPANKVSQSLALFALDQGADASRKIASFREHLFFSVEKETYIRELRGTVWPMADQPFRAHRSPMRVSRLTHVAMQWKDGQISFFHNGRWQDGPKFAAPLTDRATSPYMQLGGVPHPTQGIQSPWKGHLHQARITNRALYGAPFEPEFDLSSTPDTVALYKATHVDGSTLTDLSGNNRHGTIHGPQVRLIEREASSTMQLIALAALNTPLDDAYSWPTNNGNTLFFTREGQGAAGARTFMSRRSGPGATFAAPTMAFAGRHAVVTNDLSYAVLFSATSGTPAVLHQSERNADTGVWSSPQIIAELAREPNVKSPWISQDGKTLVYQRTVPNVPFNTKGSTEFAISHREAPREPWSSPERLPMADAPELTKSVTWPCLSDDLLRIVFCHGGDRQAEVYMASRSSLSEPFGNYRPVLVDGRPLIARAPRWSPAGDELYLSRDRDPASPEWDLYVLKGLPPEYRSHSARNAGEEWTELFNGRDLTGWKPYGNGRWTVEDGVIRHRVESATDFLVSERSFEDFEVSLEYRLAPNTDSGLFFRLPANFQPATSYNELQILDETSQRPALIGSEFRTGSLWSAHRAPPLPQHGPGQWHTLHLMVKGDQFSCSINGKPTTSGTIRPDNPSRGSIAIQLFQGGIEVRRVRLRELARPTLVTRPVLEFAENSSVAIPPLDEDWNQPFTMELWVKRDPASKNPRGGNLFQLSRQTGINLGYNEDFVFMYQFRKPGENLITAGSGLARPGEWFHVAAVRVGDQMRIYLNGKPRGRDRIVDHGRADEGHPSLGGAQGTSSENIFRGQIASVRISRGELYSEEFPPPPMNLPKENNTLLLYRMDEGHGDRLTDLSGHGHHGTIKGAKWVAEAVPAEQMDSRSSPALQFDGVDD